MNRQEILALAAVRSYPCVTITMPTHRTSPDNRQDPIRLKNLVTEARNRLQAELGKREVAGVLRTLDELAESVYHEHNLDSMVLVVSDEIARFYDLPFSLPERVMIDDTFFLRDLIYAYNRSPHYYVLALSDQASRLFLAFRDDLEEQREQTPFPMANSGPGGGRTLPNDPRLNSSQYRDEHSRIFMRKVDEALGELTARDPQPLALVGVDRQLAFFREVSSHANQIVAQVTGNHDLSAPHQIGQLVWPLVREALAERRAAIFEQLNAAVGGQRSASTLGEVWRFAHEGRGATLIVEEGYHEAGSVDELGNLQLPPAATEGPALLDDAVDELIAKVLELGGRVVFVDDGSLEQHSRIALILRY
jgi:hypothetical protein